MGVRVQIVGSRTDYDYGYGGYTGDTINVNEIVATFDDEKDARQYIKDSRLNSPSDKKRPFRQKSLLAMFQFATIEEEEQYVPPPHNPKIGKRRK